MRAVTALLVALTFVAAACEGPATSTGPPTGTAPPATMQSTASPSPGLASSGPASPSPVAGGTFRYGIGEPTAIVPPLAATADDRAVVDAVFDSLTAWDDAGRPIPAAAVTWDAQADATRWTFRLRPGASFHDGTPVTAEAFIRAWTWAVAQGPSGYLLQDVIGYDAVRQGQSILLPGLEALGPRTLQVTLVRPRADLPAVLGHPALGPVPAAALPEDPATYANMPVGNGPFRLTEPWVRGDFVRAARWDGWLNGFRNPEGIAEVVFRIADLDINFLAFAQGRREFTGVPVDALDLAAEEFPHTGAEWDGPGLITGARPETYLLAVNRSVVPYTDLAVREAVSLALDRERIAEENAGGNLAVASSLLPPVLPGAMPDVCDRCTFNPNGADTRLEDAQVSQLSLAFNAGGGHERIRDVLRGDLSAIGVALVSNARGDAPSPADYQAGLAEGQIGLFRMPLSAEVPSGLDLLLPLLHGDRTPEAGGQNFLRYDDPTVTGLLDQAARTLDDVARERLLRRVEDIALNDDQVVIPLVSYRHAVVAAEDVRDLRYGPFGLLNLTELALVG